MSFGVESPLLREEVRKAREGQVKSGSLTMRPDCVRAKGWYHFPLVSAIVAVSAVNHRRIRRARAWLEGRVLAEEVLVIGASLDAANELARRVAKEKGAAFGWHRLTLPQLAAALAAPMLAERQLAPLSRLGAQAIIARVVHRLKAQGGLGRYQPVGETHRDLRARSRR
jgi:hypothetical protein